MPKSSKRKTGRRSSRKGGSHAQSLGAGEGETIVAVPRAMQTSTRAYILGADALGTNSMVWQFQSAVGPVLNLSAWLSASGTNWSQMAAMWDEFQPISVRVRGTHSLPIGSYSQPYLLAYDNDGGAPVSPTLPSVAQYRTCKSIASSTDWELKYVFSPPAKGLWYNVQSPAQFLPQLVTYPLTTLASSSSFLAMTNLLFEFEVLFRGIR